MNINKLIKKKINLKNHQKFVSIIGLKPSKGARSPILWNKAYSKLKISTRMFPLDLKPHKLGKLINYLRGHNHFLPRLSLFHIKKK